jgi:hypothetical protein
LACRMSVNLHFLKSHREYFPSNLDDYSEEQGEKFHQDINEMQRRYQLCNDGGLLLVLKHGRRQKIFQGGGQKRSVTDSKVIILINMINLLFIILLI